MEQTRRAREGIGASWRKALAAAAAVALLVGVGFGTALSAHADEANNGGSARVSETAAPELAPTPTAETPDDTGISAGSPAPEPAPESPAPTPGTPGAPATTSTPGPTASAPTSARDAAGDAASNATREATSQQATPAAATGKISGVVRSEGGKRLAKVTVRISRLKGSVISHVANVRTTSAGTFATSKLSAGTYRVEVDTAYSQVNYLPQTRTVTVRANATTTRNFSLIAGGVLAGMIKDNTGAPVKGAWIQLDGKGTGEEAFYEAFSGADGKYRIDRLRTQTVKVTVTSSDELRSIEQQVPVKARTLKAKNFILPNPGVIVGTVTDAQTGLPLAGITVISGTRTYANPKDVTDSQGKYRLTGVAVGTQSVTAYSKASTGVNVAPAVASAIIASNSQVTVDFALTEGGVLEGRVDRAAGGQYLYDYSMSLRDASTGVYRYAKIENGHYRFQSLGTATFQVFFNDDDDDDYYSVDLGTVSTVAGQTVTKDFSVIEPFSEIQNVKIRGTAVVGYKLRADALSAWAPTPTTLRYRWSRDGVPIGGATDRRYTLKSKDVGKRITVEVTGSRAGYTTVTGRAAVNRITARK